MGTSYRTKPPRYRPGDTDLGLCFVEVEQGTCRRYDRFLVCCEQCGEIEWMTNDRLSSVQRHRHKYCRKCRAGCDTVPKVTPSEFDQPVKIGRHHWQVLGPLGFRHG